MLRLLEIVYYVKFFFPELMIALVSFALAFSIIVALILDNRNT